MNSDLNELDPDLLSLHLTDVVERLTNDLSNEDQEYMAGQTKFTVYRHKIFYFACGRAVITQISY